jgi:hypothetical protein
MKAAALQTPTIPLHPLVRSLGWFSLALGLAELLAPSRVSRGAGMRRHDSLLQGYGLREIGTGIGILLSSNPRPWLWGRVAGDVVDVATVIASRDRTKRARLGLASIALLGVGLLDIYSALKVRPALERRKSAYDYGNRSGFRRPASDMRGAALSWKKNHSRKQAAE